MIYQIRVKPNSKIGPKIIPSSENPNELTVYLREKPVDGSANLALIKTLSDYFDVPKTLISIKSGSKSKTKLVEIITLDTSTNN